MTNQLLLQSDANALNILAKGGRSFYWASHFLGQKTAKQAAHLYAFCRTLDDLADGDLPDGSARLKAIQTQLKTLEHEQLTSQMDPALAAFLPVKQACSIPTLPILHLLEGLLFDQHSVAIKDEAELIKYAYQVAGTVGLLMCPVLGCHNRQAFGFAIDMGIAMQLTNIARDVLEDACMGRRYLPGSWAGNLSATQIAGCAGHADSPPALQIARAIDRLLSLADSYYQSGMRGLVYLGPRAHLAIAVAARVYREIGNKLRRKKLNWTQGRIITSPAEKGVASLLACARLPISPFMAKPIYNSGLQQPLKGYLDLAIL